MYYTVDVDIYNNHVVIWKMIGSVCVQATSLLFINYNLSYMYSDI